MIDECWTGDGSSEQVVDDVVADSSPGQVSSEAKSGKRWGRDGPEVNEVRTMIKVDLDIGV